MHRTEFVNALDIFEHFFAVKLCINNNVGFSNDTSQVIMQCYTCQFSVSEYSLIWVYDDQKLIDCTIMQLVPFLGLC